MEEWECKAVQLECHNVAADELAKGECERLGRDGWELVSVMPLQWRPLGKSVYPMAVTAFTAWFKRRKAAGRG